MKRCSKCRKISFKLEDNLCKRCRKTQSKSIDKCVRCDKITAYGVDGVCLSCLRSHIPPNEVVLKLITSLEVKDLGELSSLSKLPRKEVLSYCEDMNIEGLLTYNCHKCGVYIQEPGLCNSCNNLLSQLKNYDHLKTLNKIVNKSGVGFHVKTK